MSGDPVEDALRAELAERARQAPDGAGLAEQIIRTALAGATEPPGQPLRSRRSAWALPAVAAASVVAVLAVALGIQGYVSRPQAPLASHRAVPSTAAPTGGRTRSRPAPPASVGVTTPAPATATGSPIRPALLTGVHVLDLTFTGVDDGWALASADCVGGPGRCTALLRTTDGRTWQGVPGAAFNVAGVQGCADPCVDHLRFADDRIGYAYGPAALLMTTDGGNTWQRQPGRGAEALESSDGTVIRLVSASTGCPGPCDIRAEVAPNGSTTWTPVQLASAPVSGTRVQLVRSRARATVLVSSSQPAGSTPRSQLFVSGDDGEHWSQRPDPCATVASPRSATTGTQAVAQAADGSLTLLCTGSNGQPQWLETSGDGTSFTRQPSIGFAPSGSFLSIGALDRATVFAADASALRRSTDSGRSWRVVARPGGFVTFLGFENDHVGRLVTDGGTSVWTTRDAGRTWTEVSLR